MTQTAIPEITDEELASIRSNPQVCSRVVRSLVKRLDRVEGERDTLGQAIGDALVKAEIVNTVPMTGPQLLLFIQDLATAANSRLSLLEKVVPENTALRERVKELEAENANLVAATKGKTFFHSDEAVNEEMGRIHAAVRQPLKGEER